MAPSHQKGGKITSNATGANGVFSYGGNGGRNGGQGDGTTVIIEDTEIITTGDGSGGIMTTGVGVTKAKNLSVCTSGRSSAPIRTDRGGGIVTVEGGSYTSNGLGSPVIYSTVKGVGLVVLAIIHPYWVVIWVNRYTKAEVSLLRNNPLALAVDDVCVAETIDLGSIESTLQVGDYLIGCGILAFEIYGALP